MKPTIFVYHTSLSDPSKIKQILFGIEEEGIPYELQSQKEESGLTLGYKGAENSPLGVGIGIGKDGEVILHYTKLKKDEPLFRSNLDESEYRLRAIGANGARLVKGLPFKDPNEPNEPDAPEPIPVQQPQYTPSEEEIREIVVKVISKLQKVDR